MEKFVDRFRQEGGNVRGRRTISPAITLSIPRDLIKFLPNPSTYWTKRTA